MAKLRRVSDGAGDVGSSVEILRSVIDEETGKATLEIKMAKKPEIGWAIKVGSLSGRTYSDQDWWMTTPVTEILEEKEEIRKRIKDSIIEYYCKFKTKNSIYEFWNEIL
ncbi:MAG: hypothetical protein JETCAE03_34750 [Ignavibacteriaceae bacterium]|jgi:hypothetical protein|nr:MAG: hypothetical protein JETCAE03_34750 [Ignavibacteriaceae bacterium]